MKAGLGISRFNYKGGTTSIAPTLTNVAQAAESAGFETITVMDHYFQIGYLGPKTDPMMEAYTVLGFLAGQTKKVTLGTLVTGVVYREPAFLIKQVTALDVLSGGRAFFGIGAAWNEEETTALGFPFPSTKERFERLEEVLQIAKHMWSGNTKPFNGIHYHLPEPINNPQPISKPHPKILIGGSGEQKTLRFVAKYGDACNLFGDQGAEVMQHKLAILKQHCEDVQRNYEEIEKTALMRVNLDEETPTEVINRCKVLADAGLDKIFFGISNFESIKPLEIFGKKIIPQLAKL